MPTSMTLDEHLDALSSAARRLGELARAAGLAAPVPTCPAWDVRALLAHQSMVHRWATAHVLDADREDVPTQSSIRTGVADLHEYYAEGHEALLAALLAAPADLRAMRFLNDAPAPREFWARRQAHETTIHMVDAMAASSRRVPQPAETGIDHALALDGIDELLRGFFTRGRSKLHDGADLTVLVAPTDAPRRWCLRVSERLTVDDASDEPGEPDGRRGPDGCDATIRGSAVGIYLALWNRGDEVEVDGRDGVLARWRAVQRVTWS